MIVDGLIMEPTSEQKAWLEQIRTIEQTEQLLERNRLELYFQKETSSAGSI